MAQEVPWASVKHDSGYLMVDYSKVDVRFKKLEERLIYLIIKSNYESGG